MRSDSSDMGDEMGEKRERDQRERLNGREPRTPSQIDSRSDQSGAPIEGVQAENEIPSSTKEMQKEFRRRLLLMMKMRRCEACSR